MVVRLVVNTDRDAVVEAVEAKMKADCPSLSFSPAIPVEELDQCLEARGTATVTSAVKAAILSRWNDDWDVSEDEDCYSAYGYNTKMFDPQVYYLELMF